MKKLLFATLLLALSTIVLGQTDRRDKFVGTWQGTCSEFIWHKPYPDTNVKITITKKKDDDYSCFVKISHYTQAWQSPLDVNLTLAYYQHMGMLLLEKNQRVDGENMFIVEATCSLINENEIKINYRGQWMHDRGAGGLNCTLKKVN